MRMIAALVMSLFAAGLAYAEDKPKTPQQEKMAACNKEAKDTGKTGGDRKKFMSECLKKDSGAAKEAPKTDAKAAPAAPAAEAKPEAKAEAKATPQERMKACNKEAKDTGKAGEDRKKFMSECLKADKK